VRGLRTRRDVPNGLLPVPGTSRAVAQNKNVVVARGLQGRTHEELVDAVALEPVQVGEKLRRLHAGRPHHELSRNEISDDELHAGRAHFADTGGSPHVHGKAGEEFLRGVRQALRKRGKNAIGSFDQRDLDIFLGIDAVEAVGNQLARAVMELGRKLGAGGAPAPMMAMRNCSGRSDPGWA